MEFLYRLPFLLVPLAVWVTVLILLLKHRQKIGTRRSNYGVAAFALTMFQTLGMPIILTMFERGESGLRWMTILSLINSLLTAATFWLFFVAISNRRKSP